MTDHPLWLDGYHAGLATARQSRRGSAIEAATNIGVGFGIACAANIFVLPWWGFEPSIADALGIGVVMTAISLVRSYTLRRLFESMRLRRWRA